MNQPCKVRARSSSSVAIIDLEGDLTHSCEGALLAALHTPAAANQPWVLLNFRLVGYINSAGISLLVSLLSDLRTAGRRLMACSLSPHFQKIFRMVGLTIFLEVHDSEEAALAAAAGSAGAPAAGAPAAGAPVAGPPATATGTLKG